MSVFLQIFSENILVFCTEGLLGADQENTLRLFSAIVADMRQYEIRADQLNTMVKQMDEVACLLYRDGPQWLHVSYSLYNYIVSYWLPTTPHANYVL